MVICGSHDDGSGVFLTHRIVKQLLDDEGEKKINFPRNFSKSDIPQKEGS